MGFRMPPLAVTSEASYFCLIPVISWSPKPTGGWAPIKEAQLIVSYPLETPRFASRLSYSRAYATSRDLRTSLRAVSFSVKKNKMFSNSHYYHDVYLPALLPQGGLADAAGGGLFDSLRSGRYVHVMSTLRC